MNNELIKQDVQITEDMYYNSNELFSYNSIISMALGERGNGKTTQGLLHAINNSKKGLCCMYVRRRRNELDKVKKKICDGLKTIEKFKDTNFEFKGDWWYMDGEPFIYCLPLSESSQFKSAQFPDFNLIIFDEYIITKNGRNDYLTNEMTLLLELVSTVFRTRKKSVYIASNSVSYANPLFEFFDIRPKKNDRFIKQFVKQPWGKDYTVVVELTDTKEYRQAVKNSTFAKMLEGTSYYKYAFGNESLEDNNDFILPKKPSTFNHSIFNVKIDGHIYGVWRDDCDTSTYYVSRKYDSTPSFPFNYAVYKKDIDKRFMDIKYFNRNVRLKYFARAFYNNRVIYENISIKNRIYNELILFIKY